VRPLNEALAFLVELAALAALGWWGFTAGGPTMLRVALGVGAPLLAAVVWGLFAAPKAFVRLPLAGVLVVKAVVFGAATAALYAVGHPILATTYAVVVVLNTTYVTFRRRS
jgi:Protein of unknown function (DUF2568)